MWAVIARLSACVQSNDSEVAPRLSSPLGNTGLAILSRKTGLSQRWRTVHRSNTQLVDTSCYQVPIAGRTQAASIPNHVKSPLIVTVGGRRYHSQAKLLKQAPGFGKCTHPQAATLRLAEGNVRKCIVYFVERFMLGFTRWWLAFLEHAERYPMTGACNG